jgi:hypothetical protein
MEVQMRLHHVALACMILATTFTAVFGAEQVPRKDASAVSQGEFAARLIKAFQWDKGLPDKPKESDYLAILDGRRLFRFEAEDHYNKKRDNVSVRTYPMFGPFSGSGWVSGISTPTMVHLSVFIPLEGEYTLTVVAKGDDQLWTVNGQTMTVNSGPAFGDKVAGKVRLPAGAQEITVQLPPEGAVDRITLSASPLKTVAPLGGWRFKEPMTLGDVAKIAVTLLNLEESLPADSTAKPVTIAAFESSDIPKSASLSAVKYHGKFSAKQWVRAGYEKITLGIPVAIDQEAVYGISVRFYGKKLSALVDDLPVTRDGKQQFTLLDLGLYNLAAGNHKLTLELAPGNGVDIIQLERKKSTPADFMVLAGVKGEAGAPVEPADVDALLATLVARFSVRK